MPEALIDIDARERIAVVESRVDGHLESDMHLKMGEGVMVDVQALKTQVAVLGTRLAFYSALGAIFGGGIVSLAFNLIGNYLKRP